ncbi:MAG TPA: NAD(P)H-dependent oxidoreductase [Opitutaceae bacterium]|nr:NAD(P)H-dependent oxidoreductase [Opitutaceae bacterium]
MPTPPRVLAFSGSARRESLNRKLLAVTVDAVRNAGAEVTLIDLNAYTLPLYHGDLEDAEGLPENAKKLVELITQHAGLLIASPEYNSMFTPLVKNTLDWCTRAEENPFTGKVAAIVSASPGQLGGVRSLQHLRHLLLHLGCHVVPAQCTLPKAHEAFDPAGKLKDPRSQKAVEGVAAGLFQLLSRMA